MFTELHWNVLLNFESYKNGKYFKNSLVFQHFIILWSYAGLYFIRIHIHVEASETNGVEGKFNPRFE